MTSLEAIGSEPYINFYLYPLQFLPKNAEKKIQDLDYGIPHWQEDICAVSNQASEEIIWWKSRRNVT